MSLVLERDLSTIRALRELGAIHIVLDGDRIDVTFGPAPIYSALGPLYGVSDPVDPDDDDTDDDGLPAVARRQELAGKHSGMRANSVRDAMVRAEARNSAREAK